MACSNRSRTGGKAATSSARRAINAVTRSMPLAVVGEPLRDAVDHLLLLGGELQPRILQQRAQRRGRLPDLVGGRRRIGHEVARRQPQFVGAAVDFLGDIAEALQVLQFGKGRVDVADGDDAGDARHDDHGQQQQ